ncbi:MAG: ATP-binding protein [Patescibacteria group bacterium]
MKHRSAFFSFSGSSLLHGAIIALLLITAVTGVGSYSYITDVVETKARNAFLIDALNVETTLRDDIFDYEELLQSVQGLFAANVTVERHEWDAFLHALDIEEKYPGMTSVAYGTSTVGPEAGTERVILTYAYPASDSDVIGMDLASEPDRAEAFRRSRDTGETVATTPFLLADGEKVFTIVMPIYRNGAKTDTIEERRDALQGFVTGIFRIPGFFDLSVDKADIPNGMAVAMFIGNEGSSDTDDLTQEATYNLFGQKLVLVFQAPRTYGLTTTEHLLPYAVPAACGVFFFLLALTGFSFTRVSFRARRLAERMTQDLADAQRTFEATVEQLPVGVYLAKIPEGTPLLINRIGMDLMSHGFEPGAQRTSYDKAYHAFREDGREYPAEDLPPNVAVRTGKPCMRDDIVLERANGKRTPVRVASAPVLDEDGNPFAVVVVHTDISKEREVDRAKSEFVSFAAHQLKTPLTSTRWFFDLLEDPDTGKLNAEQKRYVKELREINRNMFELVESLLNVSRIELGVLTSSPEPFMLPDLIDGILKEMAPAIRRKKLSVAMASDGISTVIGDARHFRIILQNLISNAVKYTPDKGKVKVSLAKKGRAVQVSVKDSGYGIPKAEQERVFTKLFRASNVQDKQIDGTGLGLYLVKAIVEKLGGRIGFESKEGKGSTFIVTLPLA